MGLIGFLLRVVCDDEAQLNWGRKLFQLTRFCGETENSQIENDFNAKIS